LIPQLDFIFVGLFHLSNCHWGFLENVAASKDVSNSCPYQQIPFLEVITLYH
jgi:hypothetical protein